MFVIEVEYEGLLRNVYYSSIEKAIEAAEKYAGHAADVIENDYAQVGYLHVIKLTEGE